MLQAWLHPEYKWKSLSCPIPTLGMIAQDPASLGEEAASLIRWELIVAKVLSIAGRFSCFATSSFPISTLSLLCKR